MVVVLTLQDYMAYVYVALSSIVISFEDKRSLKVYTYLSLPFFLIHLLFSSSPVFLNWLQVHFASRISADI